MTEDCPNCETDVLVGGARGPFYRWECHGCGKQWSATDAEPIAYDAVDVWFESRSPDGTRLHARRDCPSTDALMTHTSGEARNHRHERCRICAHEVLDS